FSKSSWTDPDGGVHQGYAVETGNGFEPVVLNYSEQYLRVQGQAKLDMFGLVRMDGVFDIQASASGLVIFADVESSIGAGGLSMSSHATGLLSVTADGVAMRLNLTRNLDLGAAIKL